MTRPWVIAALLASGCSFDGSGPVGSDDDGPTDDGPTDDGPTDDSTTDDSTTDSDGGPADMDADGEPDTTDNCPSVPNASQHDHDADTVGDVCDGCPHLAGNQDDADDDMIGDACDPNLNVPDVGRAFYGFYDGEELTDWTQSGGDWRIEGNALEQRGTSGSRLSLAAPDYPQRAYIATSFTLGEDFDESGFFLGLASLSSSHQFYCGIGLGGGLGLGLYGEWEANGPTWEVQALGGWSGSTEDGSELFVELQLSPDGSRCRVAGTESDGDTTVAERSGDAPDDTAGNPAAYADGGARAAWNYLFIVELAN